MGRGGSWPGRIARVVLCLIAGFVVLSVGAVLAGRWINPRYSAFMAESQLAAWSAHDASYTVHRTWADFANISPDLPLAVMASEDQRFPEHRGFDVASIEKAYASNQHSRRIHGASTISQQVAKNLFLWSGRSYFRKGLEAYFTVLIETFWPKRRILEVYLNVAEFGRGIYGAEAAAQRFFRKPASRLTRSDAAVLAAVLPNPLLFSAAAPTRYIQARRDWIMSQMEALGGPEMLNGIR